MTRARALSMLILALACAAAPQAAIDTPEEYARLARTRTPLPQG